MEAAELSAVSEMTPRAPAAVEATELPSASDEIAVAVEEVQYEPPMVQDVKGQLSDVLPAGAAAPIANPSFQASEYLSQTIYS